MLNENRLPLIIQFLEIKASLWMAKVRRKTKSPVISHAGNWLRGETACRQLPCQVVMEMLVVMPSRRVSGCHIHCSITPRLRLTRLAGSQNHDHGKDCLQSRSRHDAEDGNLDCEKQSPLGQTSNFPSVDAS